MPHDVRCQICGAPIEFVKGPDGTTVVAQKIERVYFKRPGEPIDLSLRSLEAFADSEMYVDHRDVCPGERPKRNDADRMPRPGLIYAPSTVEKKRE